MACFGRFLDALASRVDPLGQTLLDRALVYGTEYGEGYKHGVAEMPVARGRAEGRLVPGVHARPGRTWRVRTSPSSADSVSRRPRSASAPRRPMASTSCWRDGARGARAVGRVPGGGCGLAPGKKAAETGVDTATSATCSPDECVGTCCDGVCVDTFSDPDNAVRAGSPVWRRTPAPPAMWVPAPSTSATRLGRHMGSRPPDARPRSPAIRVRPAGPRRLRRCDLVRGPVRAHLSHARGDLQRAR